jgi:hypothetical protein
MTLLFVTTGYKSIRFCEQGFTFTLALSLSSSFFFFGHEDVHLIPWHGDMSLLATGLAASPGKPEQAPFSWPLPNSLRPVGAFGTKETLLIS